jgi:prepilin-type N-terminal cleavage/methylation domain-containing protein
VHFSLAQVESPQRLHQGVSLPGEFFATCGCSIGERVNKCTLSPALSLGTGRGRKTNTRAFTLIELMLAVAILALLTGAAALSFVKPVHAARNREAIELVKRADAMAREAAQRSGHPARLQFDVSKSTIHRDGASLTLPQGCTLREIRTSEKSITDGEFVLDISPLGLSHSYALHLQAPDLDQWLIFAGLSGEMTTTTNESQVQQLLVRTSRRDAR